jgi:hypothetical protein
MQHFRNRAYKNGFALPTILISSIVMLTVLLFSVSSTTAIRDSVQNQYYQQLAQTAGQAGVAYAEACLNANGGVPQWSNASPLQPNTDCSGTPLVSCPTTSTDPLCSISLNGNVRASFSMGLPPVEAPSVLVVAGGGSGGGSTGGGGGAGGVIYSPSTSLAVGSYPVVIGAGGAIPGNQALGQNGQNTTFNSIVAIGGGGGGYSAGGASGAAGQAGGSGGGGENYYGVYASGLGTTGQGNNGGPLGTTGASGGGGASGAGGAGSTAYTGGSGGSGISNTITGSPVYYGGGGGGGNGGAAGVGGGGAGADVGGGGIANTGGGGGGGWSYASGNGGAGGSGVVVLKYPTGLITASGGTPTVSGNYTIQTFTSSDILNVTAVTGAVKTLPNTGFVQVLRSSSKQVWRTYQQTQAPPAAVPDLCSGSTKSVYGWNNVSSNSTPYGFADPAAAPISIAAGPVSPGPMYFRKDFSVVKAGSYTIKMLVDDYGELTIDGQLIGSSRYPTTSTASMSLAAGCHTIFIKAINYNAVVNPSAVMFSLKLTGGTSPLVVSDTSWRVSAGNLVPYYSSNYYADPLVWATVQDITAANTWNTNWTATTGDGSAREVSTVNNNSGGNYPPSQYTMFRDTRVITVTSPTDVRFSAECDDSCTVFIDNNSYSVGTGAIGSQTITLPEGGHTFGLLLYNANAVANPSGFAFTAIRTSDNTVLSRSDSNWTSINYWTPNAVNLYSYDNSFTPNPGVSDCSCTTPGTTNLATNPSAESNATGWASYSGVSSPTRVTTTSYYGSASLSAVGNNTTSVPRIYTDVSPVTPGQTIAVTAYVRSDGQTPNTWLLNIKSTRNGSELTTTSFSGSWTPDVNGWVKESATYIVPSNTDGLRLALGLSLSSVFTGTLGVDGLMVVNGTTALNFADGNTPGWGWLGATNNSVSSGPQI